MEGERCDFVVKSIETDDDEGYLKPRVRMEGCEI